MKEEKKKNHRTCAWKTVLVLIIFMMMSFGNAFAKDKDEKGDNLQLVGTLKSIDFGSGSMVVDVMTESCFGKRNFKFDPTKIDARMFKNNLLNKKFEFFIDSTECSDHAIYNIVMPEGR